MKMHKEYDFLKGRRNPYALMLNKSITIRFDEDSVSYFKLPDNRNLNIKLPTASVQSMALLLRKLCEKAQWGLMDDLSGLVTSFSPTVGSPSSGKLVH